MTGHYSLTKLNQELLVVLYLANSHRFCLDTYALKRNSFSSSSVWNFEYGFLFFLTLTWPVQWSNGDPRPAGGKKKPERTNKTYLA